MIQNTKRASNAFKTARNVKVYHICGKCFMPKAVEWTVMILTCAKITLHV